MDLSSELHLQILLTVIAVILLMIIIGLTKGITKRVTLVKKLEPNRRKVVLNLFYFLYYLVFFAAILFIYGIDFKDFSIFLSSILAVLGVAFVAQWSLLSNLTSSVIIFFYYPLKIGDNIRILDKDFDFNGKVVNITGFYVFIVTEDGKKVSIPNSLILQKGIQYLND